MIILATLSPTHIHLRHPILNLRDTDGNLTIIFFPDLSVAVGSNKLPVTTGTFV